nr:rhomboid-like protein [Streptomyces pathocidini]
MRRLVPTPLGTPFTFFYALVLLATTVFAESADPALVGRLLSASSTDVVNLVHHPLLVLAASGLWIAGSPLSAYTVGFLLVLTALERRVGGLRTAAVFALGHVLATLLTEVPIGVAVALGRLPDSSLVRLDYGISFGVMAGLGALAGLLGPWPRWILLGAVGAMLLDDFLVFADPISAWGHPAALLVGIATWPFVRRARRARVDR